MSRVFYLILCALILVIMSCFNQLDFLTFFCVSSNGSRTTFEENQEKKAIIPVGCKRLTRSRFSYSFSPYGNEEQLATTPKHVYRSSVIQALELKFPKEKEDDEQPVFLKLIGEGGYAEVYKGQLEDGQFVASKRLTRGSPEEMTVDFLSVPGIIVHVDHPNIAKNFSRHLVLELSANGSLASLLYGLFYPLTSFQFPPSICFLPDVSRPKGKAGLANQIFRACKMVTREWSHHTTNIYAYGVLLLEPITVRQALDSSQQSLVMWAKPLLMKNSIKELVVPTLGDAYDSEQMDPR
ncbi:hypothetical protein NC652_022355 [Populus alba x Populus x berolinensis]|nr:hypothetical protein NC652_022355 [Populus alba x Populus x berolinensis]